MGRSLDDLPQNGRLHQKQLSLVRKAGAARFIDHVRRPCSRILQSGMPRQVRTGDPTLRGSSGRTGQLDAALNRASRLRPGRDQPYRRARRYSASAPCLPEVSRGCSIGASGNFSAKWRTTPAIRSKQVRPRTVETDSTVSLRVDSVSRPKSRAHPVGPPGPFGEKRGSGATAPRSRDPRHTRPSDPSQTRRAGTRRCTQLSRCRR